MSEFEVDRDAWDGYFMTWRLLGLDPYWHLPDPQSEEINEVLSDNGDLLGREILTYDREGEITGVRYFIAELT